MSRIRNLLDLQCQHLFDPSPEVLNYLLHNYYFSTNKYNRKCDQEDIIKFIQIVFWQVCVCQNVYICRCLFSIFFKIILTRHRSLTKSIDGRTIEIIVNTNNTNVFIKYKIRIENWQLFAQCSTDIYIYCLNIICHFYVFLCFWV